jgi:uncharacterized protein YijF (DUF1287 family)
MRRILAVSFAVSVIVGVVWFALGRRAADVLDQVARPLSATSELELIEHPRTAADKIVNGAKLEAIREVPYDAAYLSIPYPNGDVPANQGACTDVVVRALRNAGCDLQKLIHEDMEGSFSAYPHRYGLNRPDPNIDHRRVPNQMVFMRRHGKSLPLETTGEARGTWQPGDIVYWNFGNGLQHCGVVCNVRNPEGLPLVIHNASATRQADCLTRWEIIGHFRFPVAAPSAHQTP